MRYLNATRTSFGEDRRVYKAGVGGVTSTQEVFDVNYDNGRVDVFLNGVRLVPDDDYTRTASGIGTSIDLVSDIGANNVLEVVGYQGINSGNALVEDNFVVGTNSTGSGGAYSGSTTVFPVSNSAGDTVSVWRNGIKLVPTTDYTVQASANTVTLPTNQAASANDEITVQVVGALAHADFIRGADLQDDDAFGSASATKVASSESIKAYADTKLATSTASSTYQTITNSDKLAYQSVPHIIPGVLYPAVSGNDINGNALGGSYVYGTAHTDGRKYYYTDIKGSKPIKDPRIGGHFGSQRHKFKSLQLLEQETATHGNDVFSIDGREWCRLVNTGSVKFEVEYNDAGNGLNVTSHTFTAFFEITGYFNDFNCISWTKSDRADDINITVNGGTTRNSANTDLLAGKATVQTPLNGRYVDAGSVINHGDSNVASDLGTTPSINTIKIEAINTGSEYWRFYGIELIAQDTTSTANRSKIQIPSQNVVSYGKKFTVSGTPHYDPFNGFTSGSSVSSYIDTDTSLGVEKWKNSSTYYRPYNGGRVVKWVDSSGVIKTSVTLMPPNAKSIADSSSLTNGTAKANASVANNTFYPTFEAHTTDVNEDQLHEVAKTFHWREFGNGSANGNASYRDASTLATTTYDISYVMDDGLTSLSADDAGDTVTLTDFSLAGNGDLSYLTFIGTGISITGNNSGLLNDTKHIAQNLPYGTHIFKNTRGGSVNGGDYIIDGVDTTVGYGWGGFREVTFYQPKRPPIPEDACVIADYMLMADYVANTSGSLSNISKGVRMISSSRDVFYDATSSSDLAYYHTSSGLGTRHRNSYVRWGNIGSGGTDGPIITYFGHPKVDYHVGTASDGSERYHLKLTNSSGTLETTNVSGTTSSGSISNHEITGVSTSSGSAYFSSSKSDGVLGANKGELLAYPDDATYDWLYFGDAYVATPIHTSHHYQPFETPFLNELVGGDRNMEQTNLVVSPDGKTWDQITRDTSYMGDIVVFASRDGGNTTADGVHQWDFWRGSEDNRKYFCKEFAIGYDRLICLKEGFYEIHTEIKGWENHHMRGYIRINGVNENWMELSAESGQHGVLQGTLTIFFKRGDYVDVYRDIGDWFGSDLMENHLTIKRV